MQYLNCIFNITFTNSIIPNISSIPTIVKIFRTRSIKIPCRDQNRSSGKVFVIHRICKSILFSIKLIKPLYSLSGDQSLLSPFDQHLLQSRSPFIYRMLCLKVSRGSVIRILSYNAEYHFTAIVKALFARSDVSHFPLTFAHITTSYLLPAFSLGEVNVVVFASV